MHSAWGACKLDAGVIVTARLDCRASSGTCRAGRHRSDSPFLRELLIPFRGAGYVAQYEIQDAAHVTVLAARHQLEDDYH